MHNNTLYNLFNIRDMVSYKAINGIVQLIKDHKRELSLCVLCETRMIIQ